MREKWALEKAFCGTRRMGIRKDESGLDFFMSLMKKFSYRKKIRNALFE